MKLSNDGLFQLASHEGIVINPYYDSVGVITFGIGHTSGAGNPHPSSIKYLSEPNAERYSLVFDTFKKDIEKFEKRVNDAVTVPLTQYEFDALVSFDFNTGGIKTANLTKKLNSGDKVGAADGFLGWLKPKEIEGRRRSEMNLFKTGQYDTTVKIPVYTASQSYKLGKVIKYLSYNEFLNYLSADDESPIDAKELPLLKIGSTGEYVQHLQLVLVSKYPYIGKIDGIFGKNTDKAVREFQKANNLDADGKVGFNTWSAILKLQNT